MNAQTTKEPRYQWRYASEWLQDKVDALAAAGNNAELKGIIDALMGKLAEDDVQDLFQHEMSEDGFFRDLNLCPDCDTPLTDETTNHGFPSYCAECDREIEEAKP